MKHSGKIDLFAGSGASMDPCDEHLGRKGEVAGYVDLSRQTVSNYIRKRSWPGGEQVLTVQVFPAVHPRGGK